MQMLRDFAVYAPDEKTAAGATSTEQSAAVETPAAAVTETPAAASADTTSAAASAAAPAQAASWLDGFRKEGFDAKDEDSARSTLLQSYRDAERLRPLAPVLSAYQQHSQEFNQWLAERNKQPAKPADQDWTAQLGWNPPPYDPSWRHQLTTDDKGNLVPNPGTPADLVLKYQAAQQFRQDQIEKFLTNPFKFMEPAIRHIAGEIAGQQANQGVSAYREQQEAEHFIASNADWLFNQTKEGGVETRQVINPQTGRYESQKVLSSYGQSFVGHLQAAQQAGLSPDMQQKYALQAVQNEYLASPAYVDWVIAERNKAAKPPAGTPRQQANEKFNERANPAAKPNAGNSGQRTAAPTKVTRENLEQVMLQRIQEANAAT